MSIGAAQMERRPSGRTWLFTSTGRTILARKLSASSRPARLKSMRSEDIENKPWSEDERRTLCRIAKRQAAGDESRIDFEDIPRLTNDRLASMVRLREARPRNVE